MIQSGWVFSINWQKQAEVVLAEEQQRANKREADERTPLLQNDAGAP
jgi:hypothetical protein